jgi:hypothetical protein
VPHCSVLFIQSSRSTSIPGTWDSSVELSQLAGLHVLNFPSSTPSISFTLNHHILGKANSTWGCCGANNPRLGICTYMSQLPLRNWILTGVQLFLLYKVLFVTDFSQVTSKLQWKLLILTRIFLLLSDKRARHICLCHTSWGSGVQSAASGKSG